MAGVQVIHKQGVKGQWTVETLKEMVDQRFADNQKAVETALLAQEKAVSIAFVSQEKAVNTALLAAKEAVIKAEILTDKRFDAVTDSVAQVAKQTSELLPRAEYTANHGALNDKIMVATDAINRSSGDKNLYATNTYVTQVVSQSIDNLESKIAAILTPLVDYVAAQKGGITERRTGKDDIFKIIAAVASGLAILGMFATVVMAVMK